MKIYFIQFILLLSYSGSNAQSSIFQNSLPDIENKSFSFSTLQHKKGTVIVFLLSDCPATQDYTRSLNILSKTYLSNNISFVGIFPGKFSSDSELLAFQKIYKLNFPLLKDSEMTLAKFLQAKTVPSCYLLNDTGEIVYQGRIDDWLFALGRKKKSATQKDLENAIISLIKNQPIKIPVTQPIGCILEYED